MKLDFSPVEESDAIDNINSLVDDMNVLYAVLENGPSETCYFIDESLEKRSCFTVKDNIFPTMLKEAFNFNLLTFLLSNPSDMERYCHAFLRECLKNYTKIDSNQVLNVQTRFCHLLQIFA